MTTLSRFAVRGLAHLTDADCTLDDRDTCTGCGVHHGEPCAACGGRGYHVVECQGPCRAYAEHYPAGCVLPAGHDGDHSGECQGPVGLDALAEGER